MFHIVHVVLVDPERAAATGKAFCLMFVAWLAWHYMPESWSLLNGWTGGWLGTLWHVVRFPFILGASILGAVASAIAWVVSGVDSAFHIAAMVQAALFPVWAAVAGCCLGRAGVREGALLFFGAAGQNALCVVLLGYPMLACMLVVGSVAAVVATTLLAISPRSWAGWVAAALVAGLSAWGVERYGSAFAPVCWLLVPASWCCLALGAAYVMCREAGGRLGDSGAAPLFLFVSAMAIAAAGPFAANAAQAVGVLPGGMPPAPALAAPTVAAPAPTGREAGQAEVPSRQPSTAGNSRYVTPNGRPAVASVSARPRP